MKQRRFKMSNKEKSIIVIAILEKNNLIIISHFGEPIIFSPTVHIREKFGSWRVKEKIYSIRVRDKMGVVRVQWVQRVQRV